MKELDDFVLKVVMNNSNVIEQHIKLVVKDKPRWMPLFLYRILMRKLFEVQMTGWSPSNPSPSPSNKEK